MKFGMTNIDEGLFMGQTILEQLEGLPKHKMHGRHVNNVTGKDLYNGSASKPSILARNGMELFSQPEHSKVFSHARKLSDESVGSDVSSLRGSDMSNSGVPNSIGDGTLDLLGGADVSRIMEMLGSTELQTSGSTQVVLPLDQRPKLNRVMLTMQQRLVTAKTDMEDLIARLNQEIAVKDYLSTKVCQILSIVLFLISMIRVILVSFIDQSLIVFMLIIQNCNFQYNGCFSKTVYE